MESHIFGGESQQQHEQLVMEGVRHRTVQLLDSKFRLVDLDTATTIGDMRTWLVCEYADSVKLPDLDRLIEERCYAEYKRIGGLVIGAFDDKLMEQVRDIDRICSKIWVAWLIRKFPILKRWSTRRVRRLVLERVRLLNDRLKYKGFKGMDDDSTYDEDSSSITISRSSSTTCAERICSKYFSE
jgi:hypothetical protein